MTILPIRFLEKNTKKYKKNTCSENVFVLLFSHKLSKAFRRVTTMREENMTFGKFIRKKRIESRKEYTLKDMSNEFGISITMWCDIEQGRKNPGEFFDYEKLASMLDLTESEKALTYDLAARKKGTVPSDIEDVMMYSESGNYARMALRMTNAGIAKEEDWREFIRQLERKKHEEQEG